MASITSEQLTQAIGTGQAGYPVIGRSVVFGFYLNNKYYYLSIFRLLPINTVDPVEYPRFHRVDIKLKLY